MINANFWNKVAVEWKKSDDGIVVPEVEALSEVDPIFEDISNDEIDDILADLDIDI